MKWFFNIFVMLCIGSFVFRCFAWGHQSPRYVKLAHEITAKTGKQLKEQKHLYLIGTGGQMMNDIQMMAMEFNFYQIVDLQAARTLLVDAVTSYLVAINSSEEVRPYLHEYPFTAKNIEIAIYFYSSSGADVPLGRLSIAEASQGKMVYYIDNPEKHTIKVLQEETYEEAAKQVHDVLENSL